MPYGIRSAVVGHRSSSFFCFVFFLLRVDLRFGQLTNDREPLGTQIEKRKVVILRVYIGKRLAIHTA